MALRSSEDRNFSKRGIALSVWRDDGSIRGGAGQVLHATASPHARSCHRAGDGYYCSVRHGWQPWRSLHSACPMIFAVSNSSGCLTLA